MRRINPSSWGKPALVTGANSGIGEAVALGLAKAGADVAVNYVTHPETAEEVAHKIEAMGRRAIVLKADVSKEDEVEAMYAARDRAVRHAAHLGQQCRVAAGFQVRRDDAGPVEHRHRRQPDGAVPVLPIGGARVQAARRGQDGVPGSRQDDLHEFRPPGHPVGRSRELRRLQGRDRHDDAQHRAGAGAALHPGELHRAGRHPHADQHGGVEHPGGLCQPDDAGAVQAHRRTGRHRAGGGVGWPPTHRTT